MGESEMIYLEKKVICKKCGHMHEFNIRTNLSVSNFTFNATCVECGGRIVVDLESIFKGGKAPEQISSIHDPYLNVDAAASSSSTTSNLPFDLDAVEGVDEDTQSASSTTSSSEGQGGGSIFDNASEPMPDVSSFFDDIEENK
ncbi:MAG: hypothetical protein N3G76_01045 [Candidatus Micrarchaeota archaeon]|nr:hypothetical protein [Candidatus Micrarchaeota archaeon]